VEFSTTGGGVKRAVGATFRGAAFYVESAEFAGGRRTVMHEYPSRDEPFSEDMGRRAREFTVEGYVLGDDYLFSRDALITELEQPGVGELVHPYYGTRRVAAKGFRVRETSVDGGMATFSIEFVETPSQPAQPTAAPDTAGAALASVTAARAAVQAEFLADYDPGVYTDGLSMSVDGVATAADAALTNVPQETQDAAQMARRVSELLAESYILVTSAEDLYAALAGLLDVMPAGTLGVYNFDPGERPPESTANRVQEGLAFDAIQLVVQRLVTIRGVELAIGATYESYDAALAAREELTALLDEQLETAGDDAYPVLMQLRADLVKAVPSPDGDLPRLITYTPPLTVPSLVLAYDLYGDVSQEADLLSRNSVKNPGFVPGGRAVEVLSSD